MEKKTFTELYEEAKTGDSPGVAFIKNIMSLTGKSEAAVRAWIAGRRFPDKLAKEAIGKKYKVDPNSLFPQLKTPIL